MWGWGGELLRGLLLLRLGRFEDGGKEDRTAGFFHEKEEEREEGAVDD